MKPASCMFQPGGVIELPPPDVSNDVDAEGELAVIIGKKCRYVPAEHVKDVIFGYTVTTRPDCVGCLEEEPAIFDTSQEHRHVLQLRSGDRDC